MTFNHVGNKNVAGIQKQSSQTRVMTQITTRSTTQSWTAAATSQSYGRPDIIGMGLGFSIAAIILLSFICAMGLKLWKQLKEKELYLSIKNIIISKSMIS